MFRFVEKNILTKKEQQVPSVFHEKMLCKLISRHVVDDVKLVYRPAFLIFG